MRKFPGLQKGLGPCCYVAHCPNLQSPPFQRRLLSLFLFAFHPMGEGLNDFKERYGQLASKTPSLTPNPLDTRPESRPLSTPLAGSSQHSPNNACNISVRRLRGCAAQKTTQERVPLAVDVLVTIQTSGSPFSVLRRPEPVAVPALSRRQPLAVSGHNSSIFGPLRH